MPQRTCKEQQDMNKKLNTLLFILGATVVNILIMVVIFFAAFLLLTVALPRDVNPAMVQILMMLVFFGAIIGTFFIYHRLIKFISAKIDMEKYFHPIISRKKR